MDSDNEFCIVTEVGIFGELNIIDPTKTKVNKDNEDLLTVIKECAETNTLNLTNEFKKNMYKK